MTAGIRVTGPVYRESIVRLASAVVHRPPLMANDLTGVLSAAIRAMRLKRYGNRGVLYATDETPAISTGDVQ
jgi:hypothetical protein